VIRVEDRAWRRIIVDPACLSPTPRPRTEPEEIPGLLERLAEVPGPRDPRGVRHALVVVLALSAGAVSGRSDRPAGDE
jgi:hypothetical protein